MKKTLSFILCILMLFGLIATPAFADGKIANFSEDFSFFTIGSQKYVRCDLTMLNAEFYGEEDAFYEAKLAKEDPRIKKITVEQSMSKNEFWVETVYHDGSTLSSYYMEERAAAVYNQLISSDQADCEIDFAWPADNQISAKLNGLMSEPATALKQDILEWCDYFEVFAINEKYGLKVSKGQLFSTEDGFYYMDYSENGITSPYIYPADYKSLKAHPITDGELLLLLEEAEKRYSGFNSPFGEAITEAIGIILLVLFFGLIPAGFLVLGLILCIRSKKHAYKKFGAWILILAGATLLIFIGLTFMILL